MLKALDKACDSISKCVNFVAVVLFTLMVVCCVVQVFARYCLNDSPRWTEELARYSFIWIHFLGATICVRTGSNATITVIIDLIKGKARKVADIIITLIMSIVGAVMLWGGIQMALRTSTQFSVGAKIPMSMVYISSAFFGGIVLLYAITMIAKEIAGFNRKIPDSQKESGLEQA